MPVITSNLAAAITSMELGHTPLTQARQLAGELRDLVRAVELADEMAESLPAVNDDAEFYRMHRLTMRSKRGTE